jgi:serine/threonine protein kinase
LQFRASLARIVLFQERGPIQENYHIISVIGKGRAGTVYAAEKVPSGEVVALKAIKAGVLGDEAAVERLRRDLEVLKTISHPNVVKVLDWDLQPPAGGPEPCIVTELLVGQTLGKLLDKVSKLDVGDALTIILQVLDALSATHAAGVTHRNLGPQNVFLLKNPGEKSLIKLIDFGLTRFPQKQTSGTESSVVVAVPDKGGYAPPEFYLGSPMDDSSDLFACGMMLMRMLTGKLPPLRPQESPARPVIAPEEWLSQEYPPASAFNPVIPDVLDAVISKAIRKRPRERYHRASEMQQELQGFARVYQAGEPARVSIGAPSKKLIEFISSLEEKVSEGPEDVHVPVEQLLEEGMAARGEAGAGAPLLSWEERRRRRRVALVVAAGLLAVALLGVGAFVYLSTGVLAGALPGARLLAGGASSAGKAGSTLARAEDAAGAVVKPSEEVSPGEGKEGKELLASADEGEKLEKEAFREDDGGDKSDKKVKKKKKKRKKKPKGRRAKKSGWLFVD